MKREWLLVLLILCALCLCSCGTEQTASENENTRTITDMDGYEIEVKEEISRVCTAHGTVVNALIMLGREDTIVGIAAIPPFPSAIRPELGYIKSIGIRNTDMEAVASINPDIYIGKLVDDKTRAGVSLLGVPVFSVDFETFDDLKQMMQALGDLMGEQEKAKAITDYFDDKMNFAADMVSGIPEEERKTAIIMGYEFGTVANGTMLQSEMIKAAGGINPAADVESKEIWPNVGTEQILKWDPDFIFIEDKNSASMIDTIESETLTWGNCTAVKNGNYYVMPSELDSWIFPGLSSCLGVLWMLQKMYPDYYSEDEFLKEVEEFYLLCYGESYSRDFLGY